MDGFTRRVLKEYVAKPVCRFVISAAAFKYLCHPEQ